MTKPSAETTTDTFALARAKITNIAQDGIFASSLKDCGLLVGTDTGRYFDGLFWNSSGDSPIVLSDHLRMSLMNYSSSANLPAPASDAQFAFLCRRGTSEQLAVAPLWGSIAIDDIYSGAASAQTSYNLHIPHGGCFGTATGRFSDSLVQDRMSTLTLIEGPPGSGKSDIARSAIQDGEADLLVEFTALWAALRAVERLDTGRYPIRKNGDPFSRMATVPLWKTTAVRLALQRDLRVIVSSVAGMMPKNGHRWPRRSALNSKCEPWTRGGT